MNDPNDPNPEELAEGAAQTDAELPHPAPATLDYEHLSRVAEALLLAADQPLPLDALVKLVAADLPVAKRPLFTAAGLGAALGLAMLSKYAAL